MNKKSTGWRGILIALLLFAGLSGSSQELDAKVTVLSNQVSSQVDKKIFTTLQNHLMNLLNNRKWTEDNYKPAERIQCNFILNLSQPQGTEANVYNATLIVQAARPVYNSSYTSPLINWQDEDVRFRYVEFQPVEYNEGRLGSGDALANNLVAIFAYYANIIVGMDYSSFGMKSGDPFFKKANAIVNAFPSSRNITGWSQFDGQRNRYWLTENLLNNRYQVFQEIIYNYYRKCLDQYYEDERMAQNELMNVLNQLNQFGQSNPNTMIMQFFLQSRSDEMIGMLKKTSPDLRQRAITILEKVDMTNSKKYQEELKQ